MLAGPKSSRSEDFVPAAGGDIVRGADFVRAKPGYRSPEKSDAV